MFKSRFKRSPNNNQTTLPGVAADSSLPHSDATPENKGYPLNLASERHNTTGNTNSPKATIRKTRANFSVISRLNWTQGLRYLAILGFAFISLAGISFILTWQSSNLDVAKQKAGETAVADVIAPKDVSYTSPVSTEKAKDAAATNSSNDVYIRDQALVVGNRQQLAQLLNTLTAARNEADPFGLVSTTLAANSDVQAAHLTSDQLKTVLDFNNTEWSEVNTQAFDSYDLIMARDIHLGQLQDELSRFKTAVASPWNFSLSFARLSEPERKTVVALVTPYLDYNSHLDYQATQQRQQEARAQVSDVQIKLKQGQEIVRQGDVITPLQVEEIAHLEGINGPYNWESTVGTVGVVGMLILLLLSYFSLLFNQVWEHPRVLTFLGLLLVVSAAAIRITVSDPTNHTLRPFLLPLATISLLLTALFDINLAIFVTMVMAILAGYVGQSLEITAVIFAAGTVGALALWKAERTIVFAYAGMAIAGAQFVVALCFALIDHTLNLTNFGLLLVVSSANALVSTSLAFFSFSILGKFFNVTTVLSLLELAHPNQPLLRRLMREAPGTYHHSMLVSNLAEQAAEQIAGEALLARVGAYYHDIGKLSRPAFFIDNQGGGANIHDTLDPRESARIIKAHVSDGVALAHKHHLPNRVIDIIHQHHGTCVIAYFYNKAVSLGLDVDEIDFRYPGPKPQTKIAAIVMLADGCEAAVRANVQSGRIPTGASSPVPGSPNPDQNIRKTSIAEVVNKIVDDRLHEHQLDECNLTLRDIEEIRRLFTQILTDIYHPRISYPDPVRPAPKPEEQREAVVVMTVVPSLPAPSPAALEPSTSIRAGAPTRKLQPDENRLPVLAGAATTSLKPHSPVPPTGPQLVGPDSAASNLATTRSSDISGSSIGGAGRSVKISKVDRP